MSRKIEFSQFPSKVSIQLCNAESGLAIVELLRILIDEENLSFNQAWLVTTQSFNFTKTSFKRNNSAVSDFWKLSLVRKLLPRHADLIVTIDFLLQRRLSKNDLGRLSRVAILLQTSDGSQVVNLDNLCFLGCSRVNGTTLEHTNFLRCIFYRELDDLFPSKLTNVTSGISPRKWLLKTNPSLSNLLTDALGGEEQWHRDLSLLSLINARRRDTKFIDEWIAIKATNKIRLARDVPLLK